MNINECHFKIVSYIIIMKNAPIKCFQSPSQDTQFLAEQGHKRFSITIRRMISVKPASTSVLLVVQNLPN